MLVLCPVTLWNAHLTKRLWGYKALWWLRCVYCEEQHSLLSGKAPVWSRNGETCPAPLLIPALNPWVCSVRFPINPRAGSVLDILPSARGGVMETHRTKCENCKEFPQWETRLCSTAFPEMSASGTRRCKFYLNEIFIFHIRAPVCAESTRLFKLMTEGCFPLKAVHVIFLIFSCTKFASPLTLPHSEVCSSCWKLAKGKKKINFSCKFWVRVKMGILWFGTSFRSHLSSS